MSKATVETEEIDNVFLDAEKHNFEEGHPCFEPEVRYRILLTAHEIFWRISEKVIEVKPSLTVPRFDDPLFYAIRLAWVFETQKDLEIDRLRQKQTDRFDSFEVSAYEWQEVRETARVIYIENACDGFPWQISQMLGETPDTMTKSLLTYCVTRAFITELLPFGFKEFVNPALNLLDSLIAEQNEDHQEMKRLQKEKDRKEKTFKASLRKAATRSMSSAS